MNRFKTLSYLSLCFFVLLQQACKNDNAIEDAVKQVEEGIKKVTEVETESSCVSLSANPSYKEHIYKNCFHDHYRLGHWTGGTTPLEVNEKPHKYFATLEPGSIKNEDKPIHLYVVTHGWAPSYREVVKAADQDVLWWWDNAALNNVWTSNWFWTPVTLESGEKIIDNGVVQHIVEYERATNPNDSVIVLAYSWIDNSATLAFDPSKLHDPLNGFQVRLSEAYTNINGVRMANAIQSVVSADFFTTTGNKLHLMGHSHGSKVVTTATLELQRANKTVDHLTILDSPETAFPADNNGANFLAYYITDFQIADPNATSVEEISSGIRPVFVDNYVSEFGMVYKDSPNANKVVSVCLDRAALPGSGYTANHAYSGEWYAAAALGAKQFNEAPVGFDWPPVPDNHMIWSQEWNGGLSSKSQWVLTPNDSKCQSLQLYSNPVAVNGKKTSGNVSGSIASTLTMKAEENGVATPSSFLGYIQVHNTRIEGAGFEMQWQNIQPDDFFIVTVFTDNATDDPEQVNVEELEGQERPFIVLDGRSFKESDVWHKLSFNANYEFYYYFKFHYFPAKDNTTGIINIKNFEAIGRKEL